jgi:hypothetical protein
MAIRVFVKTSSLRKRLNYEKLFTQMPVMEGFFRKEKNIHEVLT